MDFAWRNENAALEGAAVGGKIPARCDSDKLHLFVDRSAAAASDLHVGTVLHGIAWESMRSAEFRNAGRHFAIGHGKPFILRIANAHDSVLFLWIFVRDRYDRQVFIRRKAYDCQIVSAADKLHVRRVHGLIDFLRKYTVIKAGDVIRFHLGIHRENQNLCTLDADNMGGGEGVIYVSLSVKNHAAAAFAVGYGVSADSFGKEPDIG